MITFRCFRNDDPPRLADIWQASALGPSSMQPMSSAMLEAAVFSKPYFDKAGLIVAMEGSTAVGFAHAAFGPTSDSAGIDTTCGSILLAAVIPHENREGIGQGLVEKCEAYLQGKGATTILGGGSPEMRSFYMGLYGGSDLPGILDSSPAMQSLFQACGYETRERIAVLRRYLDGFRPPVNRLQVAIRRSTVLRVTDQPLCRSWWEAATMAGVGWRRYELRNHAEDLLGSASLWDMQPLASTWEMPAAGLLRIDIEGSRRGQGLAKYIVAEAMHDLAEEGVQMIETHVSSTNTPALKLVESLGFNAVEYGTVFQKHP
ncbi:MAG: GNAT family N-acetyltransferase [Pirellulales bacterium]